VWVSRESALLGHFPHARSAKCLSTLQKGEFMECSSLRAPDKRDPRGKVPQLPDLHPPEEHSWRFRGPLRRRHACDDTVGIKIGPFAMVDMYGESTASARAARGQQLTARNTGAPNAAKTDALRGRNTALKNRPSASVPAPCSRGWAFT
jgi:hypothetical protein